MTAIRSPIRSTCAGGRHHAVVAIHDPWTERAAVITGDAVGAVERPAIRSTLATSTLRMSTTPPTLAGGGGGRGDRARLRHLCADRELVSGPIRSTTTMPTSWRSTAPTRSPIPSRCSPRTARLRSSGHHHWRERAAVITGSVSRRHHRSRQRNNGTPTAAGNLDVHDADNPNDAGRGRARDRQHRRLRHLCGDCGRALDYTRQHQRRRAGAQRRRHLTDTFNAVTADGTARLVTVTSTRRTTRGAHVRCGRRGRRVRNQIDTGKPQRCGCRQHHRRPVWPGGGGAATANGYGPMRCTRTAFGATTLITRMPTSGAEGRRHVTAYLHGAHPGRHGSGRHGHHTGANEAAVITAAQPATSPSRQRQQTARRRRPATSIPHRRR